MCGTSLSMIRVSSTASITIHSQVRYNRHSMDITETSGCSNFADEVTRYAWGELPAETRPRIEAHLKECAPCREIVRFVEELTKTVRDDPRRTAIPRETCP